MKTRSPEIWLHWHNQAAWLPPDWKTSNQTGHLSISFDDMSPDSEHSVVVIKIQSHLEGSIWKCCNHSRQLSQVTCTPTLWDYSITTQYKRPAYGKSSFLRKAANEIITYLQDRKKSWYDVDWYNSGERKKVVNITTLRADRKRETPKFLNIESLWSWPTMVIREISMKRSGDLHKVLRPQHALVRSKEVI